MKSQHVQYQGRPPCLCQMTFTKQMAATVKCDLRLNTDRILYGMRCCLSWSGMVAQRHGVIAIFPSELLGLIAIVKHGAPQ